MPQLKPSVDPAGETIVPLNTAVNLLRIMLTIKLLPDAIGMITTGFRSSASLALTLLTSRPTVAAWVFLMLPGIARRLGRYYLPVCLVLTIAAQSIETGLLAFASPPRFFPLRVAAVNPPIVPFEIRGLEPLFLLLVATVLASWAYGRRGAWRMTALVAVLQLIGKLPDVAAGSVTRALAESALRIVLVLLAGLIVGTLAEQEREQTRELRVANARLRDQTAAIEQLATARERNRLARDLHDTLAHSLAGLVVQLEAIDTLMQSEPDAARSELAIAQRAAHAGLQEARQAIRDLRANPVEDLGLTRALERTALDFGERAGVRVDLHLSDTRASIPTNTAATVLRIAQEALNNVEQHAGARQVGVTLTQADGSLRMLIEDDGQGFGEASVSNGHFGLQGMRERADMIGADLKVESSAGQGTSVRLTVPVS